MEIKKGGQTLIGFPALIDGGDAVTIEVFDEPEVAAAKHRAGLRRLFALQIKDALKYLEKNIPDLQKMAVAYMQLGTQEEEELRAQIIDVALDRAFLLDPLPTDEAPSSAAWKRAGAPDADRQRSGAPGRHHPAEYAAAPARSRTPKTPRGHGKTPSSNCNAWCPRTSSPWPPGRSWQHYARYLKAITLRLDKYRADPARDAAKLAELRPQEQRYWRLVAERKGAVDARMQELRWLLEELRVSFFAQELRTPQPVSVKRLDKLWAQPWRRMRLPSPGTAACSCRTSHCATARGLKTGSRPSASESTAAPWCCCASWCRPHAGLARLTAKFTIWACGRRSSPGMKRRNCL
jgi:ATP-dependent helicase HrpA